MTVVTASPGSRGVVSVFATQIRPPGASTARPSVNVPPISTATRRVSGVFFAMSHFSENREGGRSEEREGGRSNREIVSTHERERKIAEIESLSPSRSYALSRSRLLLELDALLADHLAPFRRFLLLVRDQFLGRRSGGVDALGAQLLFDVGSRQCPRDLAIHARDYLRRRAGGSKHRERRHRLEAR